MRQSGFTLIELLVVISIVSLLSSVVLSAVNTARQKATNTQVLSVAREYRNAIELYRLNSPSGGLPDPGDTVSTYCLGSYPPDGFCTSNSSYWENSGLKTALETYLPTFPTAKPVTYLSEQFYGPLYICLTRLNGICTRANMRWVNEGTGSSNYNCLGNISATPWCLYPFQ